MGIFANEAGNLFHRHAVTLQMRRRIYGGQPADAKLIEAKLRKALGLTDGDELLDKVARTLLARGIEAPPGATQLELFDLASGVLDVRAVNGFLRDERGLYIESYQIKAMLKETINILFAGYKWGKTNKGPKAYFVERVFVEEEEIYLGVDRSDGVQQMVGTVRGNVSIISYHEYVTRPTLSFRLNTLIDEEIDKRWPDIWNEAERNGLGASRNREQSKFDVLRFERIPFEAGPPMIDVHRNGKVLVEA